MSYPDNFKPNFKSEHTVELDHPFSTAFAKLATTDGLEASIRLSKLCSGFEMLKRDDVSSSKPIPESYFRTTPGYPAEESPDAESGKKVLPRQAFKLQETVPVVPGIASTDVHLEGTLTWNEEEKTALYETISDKNGITVWKLRVFEELEGGKRTRVKERIEGQCPSYLKWIVQKQTTKGHREHMESYHTLF